MFYTLWYWITRTWEAGFRLLSWGSTFCSVWWLYFRGTSWIPRCRGWWASIWYFWPAAYRRWFVSYRRSLTICSSMWWAWLSHRQRSSHSVSGIAFRSRRNRWRTRWCRWRAWPSSRKRRGFRCGWTRWIPALFEAGWKNFEGTWWYIRRICCFCGSSWSIEPSPSL